MQPADNRSSSVLRSRSSSSAPARPALPTPRNASVFVAMSIARRSEYHSRPLPITGKNPCKVGSRDLRNTGVQINKRMNNELCFGGGHLATGQCVVQTFHQLRCQIPTFREVPEPLGEYITGLSQFWKQKRRAIAPGVCGVACS